MNSQHLFLINFIIFLALVLLFVFRSKPKQPTVLNLKAEPKHAEVESAGEKSDDVRVDGAKDVTPPPSKVINPGVNKLIQKSNSVFFMYNGHEWEAFEVLGLPKGCDIQSATSHYQNLIRTSDPSTFEFFELAYAAILKSRQN